MTRSVRFRVLAREDVAEEAQFLAASGAAVADRFLEAVDRGSERIASFPQLGRKVSPPGRFLAGVRSWPVPGFENVIIYCRPIARRIDVLRVIHGARNLSRLPCAEEE